MQEQLELVGDFETLELGDIVWIVGDYRNVGPFEYWGSSTGDGARRVHLKYLYRNEYVTTTQPIAYG